MTVALDHVGISVSDIHRSLAWYEENLDAIRTVDVFQPPNVEVKVAFVSLGSRELEFIEARSRGHRLTGRNNDVGAAHIAVHTPDVCAVHDRLAHSGVASTTEPLELMPGVLSFYCHDPDGFRIQLIQLPASDGDRHGLRFANGFHHVAFTVSDLERTLGWYRQAFGLQAGTRTSGSGDVVSRMFEVDDSAYEVALAPIGATFLEIMEWTRPRGSQTRFALYDPGAWHLGIEVDDVVELHERLLAGGIDVALPLRWYEPRPGCKRGVFIVRDPDGLYVQAQQDVSDPEG